MDDRAGVRGAGELLDALDAPANGSCLVGPDGAVVHASAGWARCLTPGTPAPAPGIPFADWLRGVAAADPGALDTLAEQVRAASAGGPAAAVAPADRPPLRLRVDGTDGRRELCLTVRRVGPALPANVVLTCTDPGAEPVAAAPRAEEAAELERLRLLADLTDTAVVISDPDRGIEWVNAAFTHLTGIPPGDALGKDRLALVHGPFAGSQALQRFREEVEACRPAAVDAVLHRPDGALYWASWRVRPVTTAAGATRLVWLEHDITKRRRAEEQARQSLVRTQRLGAQLRTEKQLLTSVLGHVPHAVWWTDAELCFLGCNAAYLRLRELDSLAELLGRTEAELAVTGTLWPSLGELSKDVVAGGGPVADRKLTFTDAEQRPRTLLVSLLPRTAGGQVVGVIGVAADLTDLTELEQQLSQTNRLESIGRLAAGVAHEINTPVQYASDNTRFVAESFGETLTGLRRVSELARDAGRVDDADLRTRLREVVEELDLEFLSAEVPSALEQSLEGLERVAQIVRAMKEFSHPGSASARCDLNRIVESTVAVSRNEWKYVARLQLDLDPDVGDLTCVEGDLKQALLNVMINAAHAVEERRRRQGSEELGALRVSTRRSGGEVRIAVQDDGIGMDESVRAKIFDPFFTTKDVGKGTGQGLSLARAAVVGKHGGRIEVASEPMRGSTFTFVIPTAAEPPADAAPPAPSPGEGTTHPVAVEVGP